MRLNIFSMRKTLIITCCLLLIGLLAGSVIAFGQNESTQQPTETAATPTTATPTSLVNINANLVNVTAANATVPQPSSPPSIWGLLTIFGAMVFIVLVPIWIFARYNENTLKNVLDANQKLDTKESITKLIKALIPPEPLGMPNGSVRAVIAILAISIFAYAVYTFSESRAQLVAALITLVSSLTGFYFGARATEEVRESPSSPTPVLTTITVLPATASVIEGKTQTFTASPKDQFGNPINATVTWSSSNESVGTITSDGGVFTAKAAGMTTITATSGSVSGTATVTVT